MNNIFIIIKKQLKDTLKNKTILIQFILFPFMTLLMENTISIDNMPDLFFVKLFSIMYIGMAPLTSVSAIMAEEKEKNTLRVLMMANVKPWQYLAGVGIYVFTICMIGAGLMSTCLEKEAIGIYLCIMAVGFLISIVAGACIGTFAKNQMSATSLVMPIMMVLAFAPMIATFNEKIEKFARFFYTQQLSEILNELSFQNISSTSIMIIAVNSLVLLLAFFFVYRSKGLE